ncbi:MAG: PIN domain-containing protein [Nanoarchaeota archaeon]
MKIVLDDNNIFFSLMNPNSSASYIFFSFDAKFFIPEYIKFEFAKYKELCLLKSGLSEHEFELRQEEVVEKIIFIKFSEYESFLKESLKVLPDPKDSPYLALALKLNSILWSNDPHLKQQPLIKVYTTKKLIDELLKYKL